MKKIAVDITQITKILAEIQKDPMGGWFDLPLNYDVKELARLKVAAEKINSDSKFLVCIGVGGSYLGHRAVIEALNPESPTKLLYAGNSLSSVELKKVLNELGDADFSLLVISKSGTTLEPAIAFRILKQKLIAKYGHEEAKRRIYTITDSNKGTLHDETVANGYASFNIPENIGGRYSVLSPVGMFPMIVAGVDPLKLLQGARECREKQLNPKNLAGSALINYATIRYQLYQKGVRIEVLASFEPSMLYFNEWWKQLFGESEGKNGSGLFPASVIYTTDLHSMGQYLQDGQRNILETFIKFETPENSDCQFYVPMINELNEDGNERVQKLLSLDDLQYLTDKPLSLINDKALEATLKAHDKGGVSTVLLEMRDETSPKTISERSLGFLIYFFEVACAISAKLSGVNPFDQPGVEAYKTEMFKLLGKEGFEDKKDKKPKAQQPQQPQPSQPQPQPPQN